MRPLIEKWPGPQSPEALVHALGREPGRVLVRGGAGEGRACRYSFVTAKPFLVFRSIGSRCELTGADDLEVQYGNPWALLERLVSRCELPDEVDLPFPLGGCFGYWGYDLRHFVEPGLPRMAFNDLELPDCHVGFYDSLVVFDHQLGRSWIVATGLRPDGSRSLERARQAVRFWNDRAAGPRSAAAEETPASPYAQRAHEQETAGGARICNPQPAPRPQGAADCKPALRNREVRGEVASNLSREAFEDAVRKALRYIRAGDIYQVNLAQRLVAQGVPHGWQFYQKLTDVSPAPWSAYLDCGDFQIVSSSPELFLRLSGAHVQTRPIKGTCPRSTDPDEDARLSYRLQTSPKEMAELVMITDLLRNDLGRVCEYGSIHVPELARLERFAQVQHLVSTVEGRLRAGLTHLNALAACFPGGSVTGAPKIRAMEIIEELEPHTRGPYTGAIGYLGFNRESQTSVAIRTAVVKDGSAWFHAGAGIVADSDPAAEYLETEAKAGGFLAALSLDRTGPPKRCPETSCIRD